MRGRWSNGRKSRVREREEEDCGGVPELGCGGEEIEPGIVFPCTWFRSGTPTSSTPLPSLMSSANTFAKYSSRANAMSPSPRTTETATNAPRNVGSRRLNSLKSDPAARCRSSANNYELNNYPKCSVIPRTLCKLLVPTFTPAPQSSGHVCYFPGLFLSSPGRCHSRQDRACFHLQN